MLRDTIKTKCGFSLLELIMVIIIISALATIGIPRFIKATENTRARGAIASLKQIKAAEHIYRYKKNTYWASSGAGGIAEIAQINQELKLDLDRRTERNWDYSITATANTFTATATRRSGTKQITINELGTITIIE